MPGDFDGVVAAVTGGGSGIGLATARLLASVAAIDQDPAAEAGSALAALRAGLRLPADRRR
jgi:NAD(P)-dependent dehydrogenase (short-subunit alcohol dehydrogenase family)